MPLGGECQRAALRDGSGATAGRQRQNDYEDERHAHRSEVQKGGALVSGQDVHGSEANENDEDDDIDLPITTQPT